MFIYVAIRIQKSQNSKSILCVFYLNNYHFLTREIGRQFKFKLTIFPLRLTAKKMKSSKLAVLLLVV